MSGDRPGVQVRRTVPKGRLELVLDVERVLGVSTRQPVRAEFRFAPEDPLAVCVEFLVQGGPRVLWRIGRDLLQQGLRSASGFGDVRIRPSRSVDRPTAWLQLSSKDTAALFEVPVPPLAEWLEYTYDLVPAGQELATVDWAVAAADLLRSSGPCSG
ncbi:SsgA family sporulation/cell division regulator [Streptomyces sp. NPDC004284]|uniref:SsgA family sporulation/cell division regulator n=1 Tax=Streptomyces sp. NPDC004284 TaxID=3364695 RepID=UPI0036AAC205